MSEKNPNDTFQRFYKQEYPNEDSFVLCQVTEIDKNIGITVKLLEYSNIQGMVHLSEISKKRRFNISGITKVGKREVLLVNSVDIEKNYIDLSKKRVTEEDRKKCTDRFSNSKIAMDSMKHVSRKLNMDLGELMESVIWPNFNPEEDFKKSFWTNDLTDNISKEILDTMAKRIPKPKVSTRSVVDITCFTDDGISSIKKSFEGLDKRTMCTTITPPEYSVTVKDYQGTLSECEDFLKGQLEIISKNITNLGGTYVLKSLETVHQ